MQVDFHPDATIELSESAEWYAEQSSRAARNFLVAVDVAFASIMDDPKRFVSIDDRHQSCSVIKFLFQIVFGSTAIVSLSSQLPMQNADPDIGAAGSAPVA